MTRRRGVPFRGLAAALFAAGVLAATGCSSTASFRFRCDDQVNNGLILTIDVARMSAEEASQARQIAEKPGQSWFYSDLREKLGARIHTVTVEGRCDKAITVPLEKGEQTVAVIADYQFETSDPTTRQMKFLTVDRVKGKTVEIRVQNRDLVVTAGD